MIKYIYASKNVKSGNFNTPMLYDFNADNARDAFEVSFKETPKEGVEAVKELDIYYLGTYDTKTGLFKQEEVVFIVSGASILGDTNGRERKDS